MQKKNKIGLLEALAMSLRNVPVRAIRRNYKRLDEAGVNIDHKDLETCFLSGGDIDQVVESLILAKEAGLELSWDAAIAIHLGTKGTEQSLLTCIQNSMSTKSVTFDKYLPSTERIQGVSKSGDKAYGSITLIYSDPISPWGIENVLSNLGMRLGLLLSVRIHTSDDIESIKRQKTEIEYEFVAEAVKILPTVKAVEVDLQKA